MRSISSLTVLALFCAGAAAHEANDTPANGSCSQLNGAAMELASSGQLATAEYMVAAGSRGLVSSGSATLVDPALLRLLLTSYSYVLRKNHHWAQARAIEARTVVLPPARATTVVDFADLLLESTQPKH